MLHKSDLLTIGELSDRSGVAPSALRYYESQHLIGLDEDDGQPAALRAGDAAPGGVHPFRTTGRSQPRGDHRGLEHPAGRAYADPGRLGPVVQALAVPDRRPDRATRTAAGQTRRLHRLRLPEPAAVHAAEPTGLRQRSGVRERPISSRPETEHEPLGRAFGRRDSDRLRGMVNKVALLTAGGFAPCLSSAIGGLIERYTEIAPDVEIIAYRYGYQGLLQGDSITVTPAVREKAALLHRYGGSPIGNSRVKLTNAADLVKRGLVADGVDPLQAAADRLTADGVDVLHTIGGDDTNTTAADLAAFLAKNDYTLTVVGLPEDHRQRHHPDPPVAGRLDRGRAGRPVRGEHHRRAQFRLPDADRARGDGTALRLADRGHRAGLSRLAGHPRVAARDRTEPGGVGRARGLRAGGRLRPGRRGRPVDEGDGRRRFSQPVPLRGRRPRHDRRRAGEVRRGGRRGIRSVTSRSTRSIRVPGSPASSPNGSMRRR